ncbi:MAG: hypothetical protein B5M53_07570 [Candidatus Cloacimonas sp. 4484_209]|nr:MAG: hypothetical protein B5M53_07570 [Candidatus Cloacimonas sp. 4484_209]
MLLLISFLSGFLFGQEKCFQVSKFLVEKNKMFYRSYSSSQEIIEARTLNTKVFKTEHNIVFRIFSHFVHYIDNNGRLQDISPGCCDFNWQVNESFSGYADGLFEETNICGTNTNYIYVNEPYYYRGFVEFNTDAVPDSAVIDSIILNLFCVQWLNPSEGHDIWSMENRPLSSTAMTIYNDAANGDCYIANYVGGAGWNSWNLGEQGVSRFDSLLPFDWFAVGISGFNSSSAADLLYQCGTGYIDVIESVGIKRNQKSLQTTRPVISISPAPFTTTTTIILSFPPKRAQSCAALFQIYDSAARLVKTFPSVEISNFKSVKIIWDGTDEHNMTVPRGRYFCRLKTNGWTITKQLIFIH